MELYYTESGIQIPAITAYKMREIDDIAMNQLGLNIYQMMENSGRNLSDFVKFTLGENWRDIPVLIMAGKGGNGGGGICAARHLANHGGDISLCLSDEQTLSGPAAHQYKVYRATQGKIIKGFDVLQETHYELIIDALIGYSLNKPVTGMIKKLIDYSNSSKAELISLDVPSGVNATTGDKMESYFKADRVLTLALPKTGLSMRDSSEIFLADIGIPVSVYREAGVVFTTLFEDSYIQKLFKDR